MAVGFGLIFWNLGLSKQTKQCISNMCFSPCGQAHISMSAALGLLREDGHRTGMLRGIGIKHP